MRWMSLVCVGACLGACGDDEPEEQRQGGDATIDDRTELAFTHQLPGLTEDQQFQHTLGRGPFAFVWTPPQLGPSFNHASCVGCHRNNGRGESQIGPSVTGSQSLIRVSLETGTPEFPGGAVPVPGFGTQLQDHATVGLPEVTVTLTWLDDTQVIYGDGEIVMLRTARLAIVRPNGDPLPTGIDTSYRQAPPLVGLGLLEAIPDEALHELADPDDLDGDGVSGRVNLAWDVGSQSTRVGRFGHKASLPRLVEQTAAAFVSDMGLTNLIFPEPDGMRDVNDDQLAQTAFHISTLGVPAQAPRGDRAQRGRGLFGDMGCATCHVATLHTGDHAVAQLANQTIHPYTDLLLHDMGDELTDARGDYLATGQEWRTPPLWGIGLVQVVAPGATFLHDGRARTLDEAILWHGGEAEPMREAFRTASRGDREALIAFLMTL
ncbi:MAG: di-heme oxidoredictase family protein [Kofleriaceae bacterium]